MNAMVTQIISEFKQLSKEPVVLGLVLLCFGLLLLFVIYPLFSVLKTSVLDDDGAFIGLDNYIRFFGNPYFRDVLYNTLFICGLATVGALILGTIFAYGMTRTNMPAKPLFMIMGLLPMITPPFINAFALILLFGRVGMINNFLSQYFGFKYIIYGWDGVVISQILTTFPLAYLVTSAAFSGLDRSLEDSAQDLGARELRVFFTITLPLITPALFTAALLVFMSNMSAFGAPALLGGGLSVLAVESVLQILGIMDWGMGTTICIILLIPSFLLYYIQSVYRRKRSYVTITGAPAFSEERPTPGKIKWPIFGVCSIVSLVVIVLYAVIILGGFAKVWGVDGSLTLNHYLLVFENTWRSIVNSLWMASIGAFLASLLGMVIAYLVVRRSFFGKKLMDFLGTLPYAVPGTMMGLGFVLAFNQPPLILTGTAAILIIDYTFRRMPFGFRTGISNLKQIDISLEEASANLGARWSYTFRKVVLPLMKPAFIAGITYAFIRAITELTSTIFLVTPRWRVMSVDIYNLVESGSLGPAAAMSTILVVMVVIWLGLIYRYTGVTITMFRM